MHMGVSDVREGGGLHIHPPLSQELENRDPSTSVSTSHWEVTLAPQQLPSGTNTATCTKLLAPSHLNAYSFSWDHTVCLFVLVLLFQIL